MIVHKYGGSSVATPEMIIEIAKSLKKLYEQGEQIVVVVSAMGKTTDSLTELANKVSNRPDPRELDRLMSLGESTTISLLAMALKNMGISSISLDSRELGIKSYGVHNKARIASVNKDVLKKHLEDKIVVVAGFQGVNENGDITTLGRGGSDTTAVAIAALLSCPCYIYTDVNGIYGIDPRVYKYAKKIDEISYEEMMELAYLGAGVMEPRAIELAYKYGVDIFVGKTNGNEKGTKITMKDEMERQGIKGISVNSDILMVTIDKIPTYAKNLAPIFNMANELGINADMISHDDVISEGGSIAFTSPLVDYNRIHELISNIDLDKDIEVIINKDVAKVSLVGCGIMSSMSVISEIFNVLANNNLHFHQIATSEISISLIVDEKDADIIAALLASKFEL